METTESFAKRVEEQTGVSLRDIPVREVGADGKGLGGTIFCARTAPDGIRELVMSDTYPDDRDEETGAELWNPVPSNFVLCRLV